MRVWLVLLWVLFGAFAVVRGQDAPDYFIEASVDVPTPLVGQQMTYRVRFYDAVGDQNPTYQAPEFVGFWRIDKGVVRQTVEAINGRQYTVTDVETALYPTQDGRLTIPAATLLLAQTAIRAEQQLHTSVVSVDVLPLPPDKPEGFSGAVGMLEVVARLDRLAARQGEPITLQVSVSGTANVEQIAPFDLALAAEWRQYSNPSAFSAALRADGQVVGTKTYEWLIVPPSVGEQILPPLSLTYFDVSTMTYKELHTAPIILTIEANPVQATPVATTTPDATPQTPLRRIIGAEQAESAYAAGRYADAAQAYEALLSAVGDDVNLRVNLALTYDALGDTGRAIMHLRHAQALAPRDEEVRVRLERLRALRADLLGDETDFRVNLATMTSSWSTRGEFFALTGLLVLVSIGAVVLVYLRRRALLWYAVGTMGIVLLVVALLVGGRLAALQDAVVFDREAAVMSGPGVQYLALYSLHTGAELHIWQVIGDWVQFALPDGRLGWIQAARIERLGF